MSIGSLGGLFPAAAGAVSAQSSGSDVDRVRQDTAAQKQTADATRQASSAEGIAETDGQQHQAGDRDADGRRLWEIAPRRRAGASADAPDSPPASKDASGECGNALDLSG